MDIVAFMDYVMRLKGVARTGWNMQFPPGSPLVSRRVDQSSLEGKLIAQLDLLEVAFQAVRYWRAGHTLNPREFLDNVGPRLEHPVLVNYFRTLQEEINLA